MDNFHDARPLMRYATLIDVAENLTNFDGFRSAVNCRCQRVSAVTVKRRSMPWLFTSTRSNHRPTPTSRTRNGYGEQVFKREGCGVCHSPPLYTNNMLMPADGFTVPEQHQQKFAILPLSVGTDSRSPLRSRKGTGYYRVPSLKGVWYRGSFEQNGSVLTLEDWFDPKRLRANYVPTGFKGYGVKTRVVKGARIRIEASAEDKKALIAFLNTL